jgi:pimeloyl-ACP methyl ester carboxylesterase
VTATAWDDRFFPSYDGLNLHYRDYVALHHGDRGRLTVLCLPGLTRNCRDFEVLARHLQRGRRVLSPDLRGRGRSDRDPTWQNYQPVVYLKDIEVLLEVRRPPSAS